MNKRIPLLILLSLLFLLPLNFLSAQTTTAVNNGNWSSSSTWNNGVPGPNYTVIIDGYDINLDQDATVQEIYLSNTSGSLTELNLAGNGNVLIVTGEVMMDATAPNVALHFDITTTDSVYIGTNLIIKRNNTGDAHTHLDIKDDSRLTVNGDLTFEYYNGGAGDNKRKLK